MELRPADTGRSDMSAIEVSKRNDVGYVIEVLQEDFWVYVITVALRSEVQRCGASWVAPTAQADHLTLPDLVALLYIDPAHIRIARRDSAQVLDGYEQTVRRYRAREADRSFPRCPYRRAR